jgi:hypothetical protein
MRSAKNLYKEMWPKILDETLPSSEMVSKFLAQTLDVSPEKRSGFDELYYLLLQE